MSSSFHSIVFISHQRYILSVDFGGCLRPTGCFRENIQTFPRELVFVFLNSHWTFCTFIGIFQYSLSFIFWWPVVLLFVLCLTISFYKLTNAMLNIRLFIVNVTVFLSLSYASFACKPFLRLFACLSVCLSVVTFDFILFDWLLLFFNHIISSCLFL